MQLSGQKHNEMTFGAKLKFKDFEVEKGTGQKLLWPVPNPLRLTCEPFASTFLDLDSQNVTFNVKNAKIPTFSHKKAELLKRNY